MRAIAALTLLALSACEREPTAAEKAAAVAAAVVEVKAAQVAPPERVTPQRIAFADIEKHGLLGAGCAFRAAGSAQEPIFLALAGQAALKREGEILRFAADKGSAQNPLGSWRKYDGKDYGAELALTSDDGAQVGMESVDFPARLTLRDGRGRVVYEGRGIAQCGS